MAQYTSSSSIYSLSSAGRSNGSADSFASDTSAKLYETFQVATYENTSMLVAHVVLKSSLAKRIARAREYKQSKVSSLEKESTETTGFPVEPSAKMSRREAITAKFLENEKQWKMDAIKDADRRIAQGLSTLGI